MPRKIEFRVSALLTNSRAETVQITFAPFLDLDLDPPVPTWHWEFGPERITNAYPSFHVMMDGVAAQMEPVQRFVAEVEALENIKSLEGKGVKIGQSLTFVQDGGGTIAGEITLTIDTTNSAAPYFFSMTVGATTYTSDLPDLATFVGLLTPWGARAIQSIRGLQKALAEIGPPYR